MTADFSRFSSLQSSHFRSVWLGQRIAELNEEFTDSRDLVQWQCLSAIVMLTTIAYLLARSLDSAWAAGLIIPLFAIGGASLQHAVSLYRHHVHAYAIPALCEAFGRLRYTVGTAPDLAVNHLVRLGLLPDHDRSQIDDVFLGDYRGHQLTLAHVDLWHGLGKDAHETWGYRSEAIVMAIQWPSPPEHLPADDLSSIIDGHPRWQLAWSDGYLLLATPCVANPFDLGGLFEPADRFVWRLEQAAAVMQMPTNLIDHLLDHPKSLSIIV